MATLTTQVVTRAGVNPTYGAVAGGGDACECDPDIFVHIKNGQASPITVTAAIPTSASAWGAVVYTNTVVSVTNGQERMIGPINPGIYKDPTTGLCTLTYSSSTSITIGVFKVQEP